MEQQLEKAILITNISSPLTWAVTLESNNERYLVPKTTKDGNQTKAFTQLQEIRPMIGDTVNAMVKETPNTYVNKVGKTINGVNRIIMYFITKRDSIPVVQQEVNVTPQPVIPATPVAPQAPAPVVSNDLRIQMLQDDMADIKARVAELEDNKLPTIDIAQEDYQYPEERELKVSNVPF